MSIELTFRYSDVYDSMLATVAGHSGSEINIKNSYHFVGEYSTYWKQYNEQIFSYYAQYGLVLPHDWICYFVNTKKGLTPFSDPLTVIIKDDLEEMTAVIVHELCHVFLIQSYYDNTGEGAKLFTHISKKYPNEDANTQWHIIVNLLARYGLIAIFGESKTDKILTLEKNLPGLARAWEIIDSNAHLLTNTDPIKVIMEI